MLRSLSYDIVAFVLVLCWSFEFEVYPPSVDLTLGSITSYSPQLKIKQWASNHRKKREIEPNLTSIFSSKEGRKASRHGKRHHLFLHASTRQR
jgi:hypothetical protein